MIYRRRNLQIHGWSTNPPTIPHRFSLDKPPRASVVEQQHKVFRSGPTKVKDLSEWMGDTLLKVI